MTLLLSIYEQNIFVSTFQILHEYATKMIISVTDVTDFVHQQHAVLKEKGDANNNSSLEHVNLQYTSAVDSYVFMIYGTIYHIFTWS